MLSSEKIIELQKYTFCTFSCQIELWSSEGQGCEVTLDVPRWLEMDRRLCGTDQNYWKNLLKDNLGWVYHQPSPAFNSSFDMFGCFLVGKICVHFNPLQQIGCYLTMRDWWGGVWVLGRGRERDALWHETFEIQRMQKHKIIQIQKVKDTKKQKPNNAKTQKPKQIKYLTCKNKDIQKMSQTKKYWKHTKLKVTKVQKPNMQQWKYKKIY